MLRKSIIALCLFALSVPAPALASQASLKSDIRVRGRGTRLNLTGQHVRRTIDVKTEIGAAKIENAELLFANRKEAVNYLLIDVCGSSKLRGDARQCGAGTECNLLWIKLDAAWKVLEIKSALYESCWRPITSTDGYKISGQTLQMEYEDFREKLRYKLSYDATAPERGFVLEESALPG